MNMGTSSMENIEVSSILTLNLALEMTFSVRSLKSSSHKRKSSLPTKYYPGLYYNRSFIPKSSRIEILEWLNTIYPIWENRFSIHNPPPPGEVQRQLLRPVYWLGNWQFACLNYYCPPQGIFNRCMQAEPFPPVLAKLVTQIEEMTRKMFYGPDLPALWHLNTCLVNFYGNRLENGRRIDTARVGEHKDFEPGPVASLSLGERAIFQFVSSDKTGQRNVVAAQQWLDDGSLQIFGGNRWKKHYFHRVQRVDKKGKYFFPINVDNFETRRLNFTFRYVPDDHIIPYRNLSPEAKEDISEYMQQLACNSSFFAQELGARFTKAPGSLH